MIFDGPIPGQSLTKTPRNAPYERAPEITDPNDAVLWHMNRLSDPERLDNLLFSLEFGLPIKHATQAALTTAVARGIHNIDVSLIIAPVIHKYMKVTAEQAGINYIEDFKNAELAEEEKRNRVNLLLQKAMKETPEDERDAGFEMLGDFAKATPTMDIEQETAGDIPEEVEDVASEIKEKPQSRGLMSRG